MIYLDYQATTPTDPRVAAVVLHTMTAGFGNASSVDHAVGDRARHTLQQATQHIAHLIGSSPNEILFTSGATESLNLAIQGTVKHLETQGIRPHLACTTVEHRAVLDTCQTLAKENRIDLSLIPVDAQAHLDLQRLEHLCANGLHLLCVMAANNEVGTLYPIEKVAAIAHTHQVPLLTDATQAVGKIPIHFTDWNLTMLAFSGHKLYGPQGIGALAIQKGHRLAPLIHGGGHQQGLRSGTLNLPGIAGLGEACRLRSLEMDTDEQAIREKRDRLEHYLQREIPELVMNGDRTHRLAGNLHISIPGIPNSAIIARIRPHLAISTGSACSSGIEAPSHVLRAMNLPDEYLEGALRISLGKFTTDAEIKEAGDRLVKAVRAVQALMAP